MSKKAVKPKDHTHHIVRDALAVALKGQTEVRVGKLKDGIDVVVRGKPDLLIEVKPALKLSSGIGQVKLYGSHWPGPSRQMLALILRGGLATERERQRIAYHKPDLAKENIELKLIQVPKLPTFYCLAGAEVPANNAARQAILDLVKAAIAEADKTSVPPILQEILRGWMLPAHGAISKGRVTVTHERIGYRSNLAPAWRVHGIGPKAKKVTPKDAVDQWLKKTHHQWVYMPHLSSYLPPDHVPVETELFA